MADIPKFPNVPDYYAQKNIFVTGATGFIGKVLIEKLLRSCPDVGSIYMLMRPKRSKDIDQRVEEITKCQLFDKLRREQPKFKEKLIPVYGDITSPHLGISKDDLEVLINKINVIFHSAATVKFTEPLREAVEKNVTCVQKMVNFARQLKHLEAFVHLSTAFANCDRTEIDEKVYNSPVEHEKLISTLEWIDDEIIDDITPKLLGDKPNTYTYSKHIAESLLVKEGQGLPLAIFRPAIVGATYKDPMPGWIDNMNGLPGLIIAYGSGFLRSIVMDKGVNANIIPVDIAVNMTLAVGWYTAVARPSSCLIYNCNTGCLNPITWEELYQVIAHFFRKVPCNSAYRSPNVVMTQSRLEHSLRLFLSHTIPAHVIDTACKLSGKVPRMVDIYKRLHAVLESLEYFGTHSWKWSYKNLEMLSHELSPEDRKCFYFDPKGLHWPTYIENFCLGTKKYVMKEDISKLPEAKAQMRKCTYIEYCVKATIVVAVVPVISFCCGLMMPFSLM